MRTWLAVMLTLMVFVAGCSADGSDGNAALITPGHPVTSPSGTYTASAESGPDENGVTTVVPVIRDKNGKEVFHDHSSYGDGVVISWLSTEPEQLWVYSARGAYRIAPGSHGGWTRSAVKGDGVPAEISGLWQSSRS